MAQRGKRSDRGKDEKSFTKGLSLADFRSDGLSSVVDVKNGKIVRIRPLPYDWQYDKKQFNPWKIA